MQKLWKELLPEIYLVQHYNHNSKKQFLKVTLSNVKIYLTVNLISRLRLSCGECPNSILRALCLHLSWKKTMLR